MLQPKKTDSGIPFLSVGYLVKNELPFLEVKKEDEDIEFISNEDYKYYSKRFDAEYGDILYSRFGTIGTAKLINSHEKLIASYSVVLIKPAINIIVPLFLTYVLNSSILKKQAKLMTQGSSNQNFHLSDIRKLRIPLPPLHEQQKIASILSKVDELIQKTDQVTEQTQRLKKGLMQKLLTKGIGHTRFKDVILGLKFLKLSIPENWTVTALGEISQIIDTPHYTSLYFSHGVPVIRTTDCNPSGEINYAETKFTSEEEYEKRRKVIDPEVGDVLYTREAPPGIAVCVDRKKISVGQRIILLKPRSDVVKGEFFI